MNDSRCMNLFHDNLCPASAGRDGECRCHVGIIASLQAERDRLRELNKEMLLALQVAHKLYQRDDWYDELSWGKVFDAMRKAENEGGAK